jgi:hypothetical protein
LDAHGTGPAKGEYRALSGQVAFEDSSRKPTSHCHLISDRKLSGNTVNQMVGALRFFYLTVVLNKPWRGHEMPYPKKSNSSHILQSTTSHAIPVAKRRANTLPQE